MPRPRRGFSSIGSQGYDVAIERGGMYGFDFVELTMNDYPRDVLSANADRIRSLAEEHDVDLVVHLPHGSDDNMLASSDRAVRESSLETMQDAVLAAGDIGAEKAVLHIDATDHLQLLEAGQPDVLYDTVSELKATADEVGVEICAENMLGRKRRRISLRDLVDIVAETGVSVTIDTGHAATMGYSSADIASYVEQYGESVSHFHLNDTHGSSDDHLAFGAGRIDFAEIFAALPADWVGTLCLEIKTDDYGYIEYSGQRLDAVLEAVL